jgi:hypothetical protein
VQESSKLSVCISVYQDMAQFSRRSKVALDRRSKVALCIYSVCSKVALLTQ